MFQIIMRRWTKVDCEVLENWFAETSRRLNKGLTAVSGNTFIARLQQRLSPVVEGSGFPVGEIVIRRMRKAQASARQGPADHLMRKIS